MTIYLLDAYAWIELFLDTTKGRAVRKLLDSENILTAESTVGELTAWALRENHDVGIMLTVVKQYSNFEPINYNLWVESAIIRSTLRKERKNIGMLDTLLLAIQKLNNSTIVTGDSHFKGFKNVLML